MARRLKRKCPACGLKDVIIETKMEEPNAVDWKVDPVTGFETMIVLSTMISRYLRCEYCGWRD